MINKYGKDIENIEDCDMKYYIKSLKVIEEIEDIDILRQMFEQCDIAKLDRVKAERELKTAYLKPYLEDLYVPKDEDRQKEGSNIFEAGTDFKMIITAVGAYSGVNPKNYMKDWNRPAIGTQHFCTSYIRNDMIGTAPIRNICYGFAEMREDALMLSGPDDIYSDQNNMVSSSLVNERYYTPDMQVNNTKRFNEMDFRRIQGGEKKRPDYIVVFRKRGKIDFIREMIEAQKASKQWGEMPIVVVDIDKCLESERAKVDEMLAQYAENPNPQLAKEIKQKVGNNRVTDKTFCEDIKLELARLKIDEEKEETQSEDIQENIETMETNGVVTEEQLAQIYETVPAQERRERNE